MEDKYLNLISLFNEENVEYVVLGGHAVIAHGYLRTTGGVTFEECYTNRIVLMIEDVPTNVISLPDLIRNKQAIGRPQDIQDLENLPGSTD